MMAGEPGALRDEGAAAMEAEELARAKAYRERIIGAPLNREATGKALAGDAAEAERVKANYRKRKAPKPRG
jgi:hypothetical protein